MKNKRLSSSQFILIGFLVVIFAGTLLLLLPISSGNGESVTFTTALFTATSATCVTGLVVVPTVSWSGFGQAVILLLIQIGGLGVVTIISGAFIAIHKNIGLGKRVLIQDAFNLNTLSGLVRFTSKVLLGTLVVETLGALFYMIEFVPRFGLRGIWISIFNSVSAFCNAGMDIIGENSLCDYVSNPLVNITTILLIVLGGIGYVVWWDVIRVAKLPKKWQNLSFHTKIALSTTLILLIVGTVGIFIFEYSNSLKDLTLSGKLQASLFQSVTTRTAGFVTIPQENLSDASALLSMLLMFIGGSPIGTAGGIKTVTFAVLVVSTLSMIQGKNDVCLFNRRISTTIIKKSLAITFVSFFVVFVSVILLCLTTDTGFIDVVYEITSATATVGLSRNLTPHLTEIGKYIVIFAMYLGRIGPISLAVSFATNKLNENIIKNPIEEISVG